MKPAQPADGGRTPYAERERIINEWCSCRWLITPATPTTSQRRDLDRRNPNCPIHGDHAKEATF